ALHVALDEGARVHVPLKTYEHVKLGYAVTTWKAQGTTVDRTYVLAGGELTHRELAYVDASRARDTTRFFAGQSDVGDHLTTLARRMAQSRAKNLAHDLMQSVVQQPEFGMELHS